MSAELDALFDRLKGNPLTLDPNAIPQQGAAGDGNVQPSGWYSGHSFSSFIGQQNLLHDPEITNLPYTNLTAARTGYGAEQHFGWSGYSWYLWYVLNSGTAPSTVAAYQNYARNDIYDNPFNSAAGEIHVTGFPVGGCDLTVYVEGGNSYNPVNIPTLPYLVSALRVAALLSNVLTNVATVDVSLQLIQDPGLGGETVLYETPIVDWRLVAYATQQQLVAAGVTPVNPYAHMFSFRLKVHIVATGTGGNVNVDFGEPQLHFNYTPDPVPFAPIVASWVPGSVRAIDPTASGFETYALQVFRAADTSEPRLRLGLSAVGESYLKWGPGGTALDVRLRRSAAKKLTLDDNAGGAATLDVIGSLLVNGLPVAAGAALTTVETLLGVQNYPSLILSESGLVGYWRLGESSGSTAADSKGANPGTYIGTGTLGTSALVKDADKAFNANAAGYVSVPKSSVVDVGDGPFSYEIWISFASLPTTTHTTSCIWNKLADPDNAFRAYWSDSLLMEVLSSGGGGTIAKSTAPISLGPHHIVITKNGASSFNIWQDGVDVTGPVTNRTLNVGTGALNIGSNGGFFTFNGVLDEAALYKVVLTPAQIRAHYAAGLADIARRSGHFTIASSGLTANRAVQIQQAAGSYTGKGARFDEAEMDSVSCTAKVRDATTIDVYWESRRLVRGSFKFNYAVSAT